MCRNIRTLLNFEPPATARRLMASLVTHAPPKNREAVAAKARALSARRFSG